ncbi:hypothetical protein HK096_004636, partial [Nowakowskiella sp. JEL0078]
YAQSTTGGKGGSNYVVTSAADDGAGTLRALLASFKGNTGGKWITFTQGQTFNIKLASVIDIKSDAGGDNLTIDGRGATVVITGFGLNVFKVSNVIIHGITIRDVGVHEDLLQVSEAENVWIDHISFSNLATGTPYPSEGSYPDGACDVTNGSKGVTVSFCEFNYHNKTMLIGNSDSKSTDVDMQVTIAYNYFGSHLGQRLPRLRYGSFDVANNYYESKELLIGGSSDPAALVRNNVFNTPGNMFYQPSSDGAVSFFVSGNLQLGAIQFCMDQDLLSPLHTLGHRSLRARFNRLCNPVLVLENKVALSLVELPRLRPLQPQQKLHLQQLQQKLHLQRLQRKLRLQRHQQKLRLQRLQQKLRLQQQRLLARPQRQQLQLRPLLDVALNGDF